MSRRVRTAGVGRLAIRAARRPALVTLSAAALAAAFPAAAMATFPGRNGLLSQPDQHDGWLVGVLRVSPHATRVYAQGHRASFFYGCVFDANLNCPGPGQSPVAVDQRASFSPDGRTLVTGVTTDRSTYRLALMAANGSGSGTRELPQLTASDYGPAFLPGGREIVFVGENPDRTTGIYRVDLDGTGLIRLSASGNWVAASPDGRWLAFDRPTGPYSSDLWLMRPNGSSPHLLVKGGGYACFSPDGRRLVFSAQGIKRIDVNGSHVRLLARRGSFPVWSPDGRQIAYSENTRYDLSDLWLMRASGGKSRLLAYDQPVSEDYPQFFVPDWQRR